MSPEERSQFSRDRWASVDPERRKELMHNMRAKRIPKPVYRPLSKRKLKPVVEVPAVSVAQVEPVPQPAIVAPQAQPIVPAVVPPAPAINYEAIVQGRWYSRIAAAHRDAARANGRAGNCVCAACRVARMEAQ
jgi:hypothetical protein